MPATATKRTATPAYLQRVRSFPLEPIRNYVHLAEAIAVIDQLLTERLTQAEESYLDVLSGLVHEYEEEHVNMPSVSETAMLRFLIDQNSQSQLEIAQATGIAASTISAVLSGQRTLTKQQIQLLARHFRVSPGVFFAN